jgi:hypothetical protein
MKWQSVRPPKQTRKFCPVDLTGGQGKQLFADPITGSYGTAAACKNLKLSKKPKMK